MGGMLGLCYFFSSGRFCFGFWLKVDRFFLFFVGFI